MSNSSSQRPRCSMRIIGQLWTGRPCRRRRCWLCTKVASEPIWCSPRVGRIGWDSNYLICRGAELCRSFVSSSGAERAVMATRAPAASNAWANARPNPRLPPVIKTTCPLRSITASLIWSSVCILRPCDVSMAKKGIASQRPAATAHRVWSLYHGT